VNLAGGAVPTDRKIDGADISPLLFGTSSESPREAHYYFDGNQLQAVRSGPWKLAVARQFERDGKVKVNLPRLAKRFKPTLYNLDDDVGETTDVADKHPEEVNRLQELAAKIDADLGATGRGPGVRPPGREPSPKPLLLK
jgi:arylsulfatase A-like enzyme